MNYLSEEELNKLRNITVEIEGCFPFANFKGRLYDEEKNQRGIVFDMFGDIFRIHLLRGYTKFIVEVVSAGHMDSDLVHPKDMNKFIYDRYFN